jgi:hypothetical protein
VEQGEGFSDASAGSGLGQKIESECFEVFDFDHDGDLDILLSSWPENESPVFYDNGFISDTVPPGGNWLKVSLVGSRSNRNGIGATLQLNYRGNTQYRYHHGAGLYSQSIQPIHFGLDTVTLIDSLLVFWPSGETDTLFQLPVNKWVEVTENAGYAIIHASSNKKTGCMDPNSCSYDPEAVFQDDMLCTYLPGGQISGAAVSGFLRTESYTYTGTEGDEFVWVVENGTLLEGQGTSEVQIAWGIADEGVVSVYEIGECYGETVSMTVRLSIEHISLKHSVARIWNEALLEAIREDYARPTIHARNLFHTAAAMYDAWAVYDEDAEPYFLGNEVGDYVDPFDGFLPNEETEEARKKTLSYAAYRLLSHRFAGSPEAYETRPRFDQIMLQLDYDTALVSKDYSGGDPAALGNYIAQSVIDFGLQDGCREGTGYDNAYYEPVNPPLAPATSGNPSLIDPNRWQPLALESYIDQSGHLIEGSTPGFLSPEWGNAVPFSLKEEDVTIHNNYRTYHDPGAPPHHDKEEESEDYKWGFSLVSIWGSHLNPYDSVIWDISPGSIGNLNIDLYPVEYPEYPSFYKFSGGDIGEGWTLNPVTHEPYETQLVPRGDYARVLAEFWADGPDSETPPGHWFTILNYVSDHKMFAKRYEGEGEILDPLEWDIKSYFTLAGAMHDAAIAAWSIKGRYDYIRPISAIRYMAGLGQSTDPNLANYHEQGIPLVEGYIEIVGAGDDLAGPENEHVGKIKLFSWRGHDYIEDPETDQAGVGWILAENWWPYQRPSFVTPPFAGFVSGHSTFSRAAAEVMTRITGDAFFPGGYGEFVAPRNDFLVFEEGPSVDVRLRWATYRDASDQCSLSRIWGGIHPPVDDIPGRLIGEKIGNEAFELARDYFTGGINAGIPVEMLSHGGLYPNPVKTGHPVRISHTHPNQAFQLLDVQGRIWPIWIRSYAESGNTTVLDPGNLPPGIYFIRSEGQVWKLVVE